MHAEDQSMSEVSYLLDIWSITDFAITIFLSISFALLHFASTMEPEKVNSSTHSIFPFSNRPIGHH